MLQNLPLLERTFYQFSAGSIGRILFIFVVTCTCHLSSEVKEMLDACHQLPSNISALFGYWNSVRNSPTCSVAATDTA